VNNLTDSQLLRDYVQHRSEAAFAELVRRHVDLVYSAALRMVRDAHLAEDVTQSAFVALAQNARQLAVRPVLSGWLHYTARNLASKAVRTDVRRRAREQEAAVMNELLATAPDHDWKQIAPQLDDALSELSEPDRDALLLRYFEKKSAHEMAQTLGISDDAAQKRVNRAVERLREFFAKRGLTIGASGLVVVISANAVQAAPAALAATICTTIATVVTTATTATITTHATMNWINLKSIAAIITSALVAGTATHVVQQREADRLRTENQNLAVQQASLAKERDNALAAAAMNTDQLEGQKQDQSELLRLRREVGQLRTQQTELDKVRDENQKLRTAVTESRRQVSAQSRPLSIEEAQRNECINNLRQIDGAMQQCALENNMTATNIVTAEQLLPYLPRSGPNPQLPRCPAGGTYTFGSLTNAPTCSIPGHALQQ
jgi:RNA polymerase sigma factor (sigma-70 family)